MSYVLRDDISACAGETVMELDAGELVAVRYARKLLGDRLAYWVSARVVGAKGEDALGADGKPSARDFKHGRPLGGESPGTARQCLLAVLGEPTSLALSESVLASYRQHTGAA